MEITENIIDLSFFLREIGRIMNVFWSTTSNASIVPGRQSPFTVTDRLHEHSNGHVNAKNGYKLLEDWWAVENIAL